MIAASVIVNIIGIVASSSPSLGICNCDIGVLRYHPDLFLRSVQRTHATLFKQSPCSPIYAVDLRRGVGASPRWSRSQSVWVLASDGPSSC